MSDKLTFDDLQKSLDVIKNNYINPPITEPHYYFGSVKMCEIMKGKGTTTHIIADKDLIE